MQAELDDDEIDDRIYFRTTFAAASGEDIGRAIERFGDGLRAVFALGVVHGVNGVNGHAA